MVKTNPKLKVGDYVKIYQKPMTQERYEGIGKVVAIHQEDQEFTSVEVSFRDDKGPFPRLIYRPMEIIREKYIQMKW